MSSASYANSCNLFIPIDPPTNIASAPTVPKTAPHPPDTIAPVVPAAKQDN